MLSHGYVPASFSVSYNILLPKGNLICERALAVDDFRDISIRPIISSFFNTAFETVAVKFCQLPTTNLVLRKALAVYALLIRLEMLSVTLFQVDVQLICSH